MSKNFNLQKIVMSNKWLKLGVSVVVDVVDAIIIMPGAGVGSDVLGGTMAIMLWGNTGALAYLELFDPTMTAERFVPSCTLIGLYSIISGQK